MMRAARVQDAFIDVVCDDEDLVRAEFDALIQACWPEDPSGAAPPVPRRHGIGQLDGAARLCAGTCVPAARHGGSERAPPVGDRHRVR